MIIYDPPPYKQYCAQYKVIYEVSCGGICVTQHNTHKKKFALNFFFESHREKSYRLKCWTFAMSCCIAGAVGCIVLTGSMSGVALGYNYSLAEYIDMKETNVSVYVKRGVFDDEIADDMDWRRSGHLPVSGHLAEWSNADVVTSQNEDSLFATPGVGRRMDDSVFDSDDHHRFEGSLMKLTAKPLDVISTANLEAIVENEKSLDSKEGPKGSLETLKDLQAKVNLRKSNILSRRFSPETRRFMPSSKLSLPPELTYATDDNGNPIPIDFKMFRTQPRYEDPNQIPGNSHRYAVPRDGEIFDRRNWVNQRVTEEDTYDFGGNSIDPKRFPSPITPRVGPLRPSKFPPGKPITVPTLTTSIIPKLTEELGFPDYKVLKKNILLQPGINSDEFLKKMGQKGDSDEYDEEMKGIPVRRRKRDSEYHAVGHTAVTTADYVNQGANYEPAAENKRSTNNAPAETDTDYIQNITDFVRILETVLNSTDVLKINDTFYEVVPKVNNTDHSDIIGKLFENSRLTYFHSEEQPTLTQSNKKLGSKNVTAFLTSLGNSVLMNKLTTSLINEFHIK